MEWVLFCFGVLLILCTGFFVAAEFSFLALDQAQVKQAAVEGDRGAKRVFFGLKSLSTQLSGAQLGITFTTLLTGYVLEPVLSRFLREPLAVFVPEVAIYSVTTLFAMFVATFFSMLIGELVPKNIAIALPMQTARFVAPFQLFFTKFFKYFIVKLNGFSNRILRLWGMELKEELGGARSVEELFSLVKRSADLGTLDKNTANFVAKTLAFSTYTAADVMTPRTNLETLHVTDSVEKMLQLCYSTGFSRFPILGDSPDDILGVVHIKAAFAVSRGQRSSVRLGSLLSPVLRVPESVGLNALLVQLRGEGLQLAVVVDEYGGTAGLVTLEDLVEEIVGDLADEHDHVFSSFRKLYGGQYLFSGMLRPDEIGALIEGLVVPDAASYETVGGFMMAVLGRIAVVGDCVEVSGGELFVQRMEGKRVSWVRFVPLVDVSLGLGVGLGE